jgi:hypothetical protein
MIKSKDMRWLLFGLPALAVFACLIAIAIPNFVVPPRRTGSGSNRNGCINNLRLIDGAKEQWALEHHAKTNAVVAISDIAVLIKGGFPKCPARGSYTIGRVGENPKCSVPGHSL